MYKVFLADDEAAMRAGIRKNIDWENSGFILAGEAPDGELAISLMHEIMPDILITDVRMPFMDGIELSRRAKKTMPWIKIIILSGHDEFEYAKQAISIGVDEYLLKPVTSEILITALKNVADSIDQERSKLKSIEKLIDEAMMMQSEKLLSGLLYGRADMSFALAEAKKLKLPIIANFYIVMILEIHPKTSHSYGEFQNACALAINVLSRWDNVIFLTQGLDRIICVVEGENEKELDNDAYTCAQSVKYEVERTVDCAVSAAIGTIVSSIGDWPKSLDDANMAKRYISLINRWQIISVSDVRSGGIFPFNELNKLPTLDKLMYISKADIPMLLEDSFKNIDSLTVASFMFVNYIFVDILIAATKMLEEYDAAEILGEFTDINSILNNSDLTGVKEILESILVKMIDFRDLKAGSKYNDVISSARNYIEENFGRQDISLNVVAKEVNMSPNHFSTIFSQETGETFISYITKIRIDKAKALLKTTTMRTSDIAYEVGYSDTHYFSYVFKKNTGLTPKEFRK